MRWLAIAALSLFVGFFHATAHAQQTASYVHIVRGDETLASIAERYYGSARREKVLVMENGLHVDGATICVGMRLHLPTVTYHRVAGNETWNSIAARYYGEARRAHELISANPAERGAADPGAVIVIPYPLRHIASQVESLTEIARHYYDDPAAAVRLRQFNNIRGDRVERGQVILVPLRDLTLSSEGRRLVAEDAASAETRQTRELQERIDAELPALGEHNRRGRYLEALAHAHRLLGSGVLTQRQEVVVLDELATAYVALERRDLAVACFARVLELQPDFSKDAVRTSPRVLEALSAARQRR